MNFERESDWFSHKRNSRGLPALTGGLDNLLAYPTCRSRALGANTESLSGFVSNLNNSMMFARLWVLCLLARSSGLACNSRLGKSQVNKLSRTSGPSSGQPDNRMLIEPSAMRQIQINYVPSCEIASSFATSHPVKSPHSVQRPSL